MVIPLLVFIGKVLLFAAGMEIASYILHRWLFHGPLWFIHRSHHEPSNGSFEVNDVFSLGFAALAIYGIWVGYAEPLESWWFAMGVGVTAYGAAYFFIHDVITHGRYLKLSSKNWLVNLVKKAHHRHHNVTHKPGQEPYGLFLFPYDKYIPRRWRNR